MNEFDLLKTNLNKSTLTGRVAITDSIPFRVSVSIAVAAILTILTLGFLDFDVPEWANAILSFSYVIGYTFALIALLFGRNAGSVKMGKRPQNLGCCSEITRNINNILKY